LAYETTVASLGVVERCLGNRLEVDELDEERRTAKVGSADRRIVILERGLREDDETGPSRGGRRTGDTAIAKIRYRAGVVAAIVLRANLAFRTPLLSRGARDAVLQFGVEAAVQAREGHYHQC
jgi:hypothetical protein